MGLGFRGILMARVLGKSNTRAVRRQWPDWETPPHDEARMRRRVLYRSSTYATTRSIHAYYRLPDYKRYGRAHRGHERSTHHDKACGSEWRYYELHRPAELGRSKETEASSPVPRVCPHFPFNSPPSLSPNLFFSGALLLRLSCNPSNSRSL
jgi:hypothetical protein